MRKRIPMLSVLTAALLTANVAAAHSRPLKAASHIAKQETSWLKAPEVLPATDITKDGFTANWKASAGADGYAVFVNSCEEAAKAGRYAVMQEDFSLVYLGSVIEPVFLEEMTSNLDDYECTFTPDWTVSQCIFAGGKIGGVIWTPYLDVRADGGKYRVSMTIQGYAGQEIVVVSNGSTEDTRKFLLADNGNNFVELDFENGSQDTFLRIVDNGFPDDTEGLHIDKIAYLDDIEVSQEFAAGDNIYRLVAVGETENTSYSFAELPYRNGETRLFYDIYATSFYFPDPDDEWNYETYWSDFSSKQEVLLEGHTSIDKIMKVNNLISISGSTVNCEGAFTVYSANGMTVANAIDSATLPAGFYIIRTSTGKTVKAAIK